MAESVCLTRQGTLSKRDAAVSVKTIVESRCTSSRRPLPRHPFCGMQLFLPLQLGELQPTQLHTIAINAIKYQNLSTRSAPAPASA